MKLRQTLRGATTAGCVMALLAIGAGAQDYTHPKNMQLPAATFERPDPAGMQHVLANGLTAYVAEDHRAPLATITAYIGVGSGHGAAGAAEVLAAALRRGPAEMASGAFANRLKELFADYNVSSGHEMTAISLDVPVEHAGDALELLADTLIAPRFDAMEASGPSRASSTPESGIDYAYSLDGAIAQFEDALFASHPFRRDGLAEPGVVRALHAEAFRGGNITVAFAGDFDAALARRELSAALEELPAGDFEASPQSFPDLATRSPRQLFLKDVNRDQGWVVIGHELPVVTEADEAALHVMDYILGAYHLDSRLLRNSRERRGLTNDNSSFLEPGVRGPGAYSLRTYGRPEAVRLLVDISFRELERMREELPSDDELFVARGALVDGLYARRYATGLDAAQAYAEEWLKYGSHDRSASYPDRVRAVSAEDVRTAARRYLHPERMIVSVVGPLARIRAATAIEGEGQLERWGEVVER
ncbi:MAG: pitrilysin family protein [Halieaceae bacterium]|jgi:predicted Zn-dependent peptidase|nr:pitrilysin family protein [Halieaceae bacterium]